MSNYSFAIMVDMRVLARHVEAYGSIALVAEATSQALDQWYLRLQKHGDLSSEERQVIKEIYDKLHQNFEMIGDDAAYFAQEANGTLNACRALSSCKSIYPQYPSRPKSDQLNMLAKYLQTQCLLLSETMISHRPKNNFIMQALYGANKCFAGAAKGFYADIIKADELVVAAEKRAKEKAAKEKAAQENQANVTPKSHYDEPRQEDSTSPRLVDSCQQQETLSVLIKAKATAR